jgi:hypothetical protein
MWPLSSILASGSNRASSTVTVPDNLCASPVHSLVSITFHHAHSHDCLSCFYCAYESYKELCDEVGVQTLHAAFVVEILMYWRSRLQMVEQFEDRVEDRLVEMEEKLQAVSEKATQIARTLESERTTKQYAPPSRKHSEK